MKNFINTNSSNKLANLYLPIRYSLIYLLLTYALFSFSAISTGVDNFFTLTIFVLSAYLCLYLGYHYSIQTTYKKIIAFKEITIIQIKKVRIIFLVGSIYLLLWGINQINDFGGTSIAEIWNTVTNPGAAYGAKFQTYEERIIEQSVNRITQILVLFSIIFTISVPVIAAYWKYMQSKIKIAAVIGIFTYVVAFLYIGTQKGLGDILLLTFAGWSVLKIRNPKKSTNPKKMRTLIVISIIFSAIILYMILNQASRVTEFGLTTTLMTKDIVIADTFVASIFGENFATGFYLLLGYPTHGYLGLSHNLSQDFIFSYGAGFSQAFESYRYQYLGGDDNLFLTYPYRTEAITGWPAGMYWATAFPWFASDLSFWGVLPLMFLIGMLFARTWLACLYDMDVVSLGILGQLFIFVAFLPANNQVLISRQGLLSVIVLTVILLLRVLSRIAQNSLR